MIDLTPLDVRKKRGDFRKVMRGYDPEEVDTFLEVVAERLEAVVRERRALEERAERLQERVDSQEGRAEAVREALVSAQELRNEIREQAEREADLLRREAEAEASRILDEARRQLEERRSALEELERARLRFLRSFRGMLERQLDAVEVEEEHDPMEEMPLEIEFSASEVDERASEPGHREGRTDGAARSAADSDRSDPSDPSVASEESEIGGPAEAEAPAGRGATFQPGFPEPAGRGEGDGGGDPGHPSEPMEAPDSGRARSEASDARAGPSEASDAGGEPSDASDAREEPADAADDPAPEGAGEADDDTLWLSSILDDETDEDRGDDRWS